MIYFFGGSFDPITLAHINIIKAIHKQVHYEDRFIVSVANNDEKNYQASLDERFQLVHDTLIAKFPQNAPELIKQDKRTYAFLRENFMGQENEITICMGEDEWKSLLDGRWVNYDLILSNYQFLIIGRQNSTVDLKGYKGRVFNISDCQDVSSSAVREILNRNPECHYEDVKAHITHQTFRSIKENGLYHQNDFDYEKQEQLFLNRYHRDMVEGEWPEPSVTTDTIAYNGDKILLVRRKKPPFQNYWALPGGFFEKADADLNYGAARELKEETSLDLDPNKFIQIKAYGHNFDPRMKIVDVAFAVRVAKGDMNKIKAADDAADVRWFELNDLPALAFHHKLIISDWQENKEV